MVLQYKYNYQILNLVLLNFSGGFVTKFSNILTFFIKKFFPISVETNKIMVKNKTKIDERDETIRWDIVYYLQTSSIFKYLN